MISTRLIAGLSSVRTLGNRHKCDKTIADRSGVGLKYGKFPKGHVVMSSPLRAYPGEVVLFRMDRWMVG